MISIVTVTYNSATTIRRLVTTLYSYLGDRVSELVIIDNCSADETKAVVRELMGALPTIRLVENSENVGYRRAANQGVHLATNDVVMVINPDAWLTDDSVGKCIDLCKADPQIGYVSPLEVEPGLWPPSNATIVVVPFLYRMSETFQESLPVRQVDVAGGAAFVTRRSHFLDVGGYDEGLFMYNEEEELCLKLRTARRRVLIVPAAQVRHDRGVSVRFHGSRRRFLLPRLLSNARYLYMARTEDRQYRRVVWTFLFVLRALEFSLGIWDSAPLRTALAPWNSIARDSRRRTVTQAEWNLRLWVPAALKDLRQYLKTR